MDNQFMPSALEDLAVVLNLPKGTDLVKMSAALDKAATAIKAAPDGSITLKYPPEGVAPKVQMRRPKAKDQINAQRAAKTPEDAEIYLMASLCEVAPEVIEDLEIYDYGQLQDAYTAYSQGKHSPERPSSGKRA